MIQQRKTGPDRREELLERGLVIARASGWWSITRVELARQCGISESAVRYHYPRHADYINELLTRAIRRTDRRIIAQIIAGNHPLRAKAEHWLAQ